VDKVLSDLNEFQIENSRLLFKPLLALAAQMKAKRTLAKGGIDYSRINKVLLSRNCSQVGI